MTSVTCNNSCMCKYICKLSVHVNLTLDTYVLETVHLFVMGHSVQLCHRFLHIAGCSQHYSSAGRPNLSLCSLRWTWRYVLIGSIPLPSSDSCVSGCGVQACLLSDSHEALMCVCGCDSHLYACYLCNASVVW